MQRAMRVVASGSSCATVAYIAREIWLLSWALQLLQLLCVKGAKNGLRPTPHESMIRCRTIAWATMCFKLLLVDGSVSCAGAKDYSLLALNPSTVQVDSTGIK